MTRRRLVLLLAALALTLPLVACDALNGVGGLLPGPAGAAPLTTLQVSGLTNKVLLQGDVRLMPPYSGQPTLASGAFSGSGDASLSLPAGIPTSFPGARLWLSCSNINTSGIDLSKRAEQPIPVRRLPVMIGEQRIGSLEYDAPGNAFDPSHPLPDLDPTIVYPTSSPSASSPASQKTQTFAVWIYAPKAGSIQGSCGQRNRTSVSLKLGQGWNAALETDTYTYDQNDAFYGSDLSLKDGYAATNFVWTFWPYTGTDAFSGGYGGSLANPTPPDAPTTGSLAVQGHAFNAGTSGSVTMTGTLDTNAATNRATVTFNPPEPPSSTDTLKQWLGCAVPTDLPGDTTFSSAEAFTYTSNGHTHTLRLTDGSALTGVYVYASQLTYLDGSCTVGGTTITVDHLPLLKGWILIEADRSSPNTVTLRSMPVRAGLTWAVQ